MQPSHKTMDTGGSGPIVRADPAAAAVTPSNAIAPLQYLDSLTEARRELTRTHVGVRSPLDSLLMQRAVSDGHIPLSSSTNNNNTNNSFDFPPTAVATSAAASNTMQPPLATSKSAPTSPPQPANGMDGLIAPPPSRQVSAQPSAHPSPASLPADTLLPTASNTAHLTPEQLQQISAAEMEASHGHAHPSGSGLHSHAHHSHAHAHSAAHGLLPPQARAALLQKEADSSSGAGSGASSLLLPVTSTIKPVMRLSPAPVARHAAPHLTTSFPVTPHSTGFNGNNIVTTAVSATPSHGADGVSPSPYPTPRAKFFPPGEVGPYRRIKITEIDATHDPELKQVCVDFR